MWRMTPRLATATLTATLAFAFAFATAPTSQAASVQTYAYNTWGSISGPSGDVPISFDPQSSTSILTTPGSVVLGEFITNPLPPTATLTYNNTAFSITLNIGAINPNSLSSGPVNDFLYNISGVLNGTIGGDGTSSMMATVTSITAGSSSTPPFPISDLVIGTQGIGAPSGSAQGVTMLTAQILVAGLPISSGSGPSNPNPTPEPSTIAVFGLALAGWAFHRRTNSRAKATRA
jgi:PEP-CTERM motif